ncbi:tetratricopeptide repeat protein [Candidatus Fermentibacteria bacterium]|nr:tetratricopeptide repeat protein [Candidatus Fermentibacteria bacterium]
MRNLVPRHLCSLPLDGNCSDSMDCSCLLLDVAGFTAVTEQLLKKGQSGAEELSHHLNGVFGPMVDSVLDRGGFVAGYAGDALTAVFPPDAFDKAEDSARCVIENLRSREGVRTSTGTFSLTASAALDRGRLSWSFVQYEGGYAWFYLGDIVRSCADLLDRGERGKLTISRSPEASWTRPSCFQELPSVVPESTDRMLRSDHLVNLPMPGEFRPVASVFARAEIPDGEMPRILGEIMERCAAYGGYFNVVEGKSEWPLVSVLFGAPRSWEDDLTRAVEFALEVRGRFETRLAMGVTYGSVYAGAIGSERRCTYSVLGHQVNMAARLASMAPGGTILLPEYLADELEPDYVSSPLGSHALKGVSGSIRVFALEGRPGRTLLSGEEIPLIGRNRERKVLVDHCRRAAGGSSPGVLYVYGEAGTSKSRLVSELDSFLGSDFRVVSLRSERAGGGRSGTEDWMTGFFPRPMGRQGPDESADLADWLEETLFDAGLDARSTAAAIDRLAPMEGELKALLGTTPMTEYLSKAADTDVLNRLATATATYLQLFSSGTPIVLVLENLDSVEADKKRLFELVAGRLRESPVAVVVTSRPLDDGTMPVLELEAQIPMGRLVLGNLSPEETAVLLEELLGLRPGKDLVSLVYDRAGGNPLFTEQLCAYLSESELLLSLDEEGAVEITETEGNDPGSVSGVMVARLDRLPTRIKLLAGMASVLAQPFDARVLSGMWNADDFHALLSEGSRLLLWRNMGEQRYEFVHPMLRDTAYGMQLPGSRRRLHRLAARAMLDALGEEGPHLPELAGHLEQAGDPWASRQYLKKAAQAALSQWRNHEAAELFERLMRTVPRVSEDWLAFAFERIGALHKAGQWDRMAGLAEEVRELSEKRSSRAGGCLWLGRALKARGDSAGAVEVLKEGIELAQKAGRRSLEIMLLSEYGDCLSYLGESDREREVRKRQLQLARELADPKLLLDTEVSRGYLFLGTGEYERALESFESALGGAKTLDAPALLQRIFSGLGNTYWFKGDLDGAESYYCKAIELAERIGDRRGIGAAATNLGNIRLSRGRYAEALECYRKRLRLATELGDRRGIANALGNEGSVLYKMSRPSDAGDCFERMLGISEELSYTKGESIALGNLATLALDDGDCRTAMQLARRKLSICESTGDRAGKAFALGRLASVSRFMGRFEQAEEYDSERLKILRRLGNERKQASCLFDYSVTLQMQRRGEEALNKCERGLDLMADMERGELYCMLQNQAARLLLDMGRMEEARARSDRAVRLAEDLRMDKLLRDALETRARLVSRTSSSEALGILQGLMESSEDTADRANCLYWMVKIQPDPDRAGEALDLYRRLVNDAGWRFFEERITELEGMLQRCL